ncbi:Protein CROWDED NUCLEI 1 isoform B [Glycine soja]|uniref:Protein CROWDED NUCLEI 1 isoform B n=1 Tax=Glycine soja TaxID=3848 RepID=A0A445FYP7_GLYSO|nr:Protein CROWDED NUCLEI 1 isoform B [Glycine soja]
MVRLTLIREVLGNTIEDTPIFVAGFANLSLEIIGFFVHVCSNQNFFALENNGRIDWNWSSPQKQQMHC